MASQISSGRRDKAARLYVHISLGYVKIEVLSSEEVVRSSNLFVIIFIYIFFYFFPDAAAQGVLPDQIIFTEVAMKQEHIKRSALADLFLDTYAFLNLPVFGLDNLRLVHTCSNFMLILLNVK